jgi:hypothetical protein
MTCICIQILRLEPYFEVQKPAHSQQSGVTSEAGSAVAIGEKKVQDLTSLYGAKKDKDTVCFLFRFTNILFVAYKYMFQMSVV